MHKLMENDLINTTRYKKFALQSAFQKFCWLTQVYSTMKFMKFDNQWKLITVDHNILPTAIKNTKKQLFKINTWLLHSVCWEPRFLELFGLRMCVGIRIGGECRLTPRVVLDRGLARDISCLLEGVAWLGRVARTSLTLGEIGLLFCKTNCFQLH